MSKRQKLRPQQLAVEAEEQELLRRIFALPRLRQIPFFVKAAHAVAEEHFGWAKKRQELPAEKTP